MIIYDCRPYGEDEQPSLGDNVITPDGRNTFVSGYINSVNIITPDILITPLGRFYKSVVLVVVNYDD